MNKKAILLSALLLFGLNFVHAQDVIITTESDMILAKILEIGEESISYKKFDNQDGPLYKMSVSRINKIKFQNGTEQTFSESIETVEISTEIEEKATKTDSVLIFGSKFQKKEVFWEIGAGTSTCLESDDDVIISSLCRLCIKYRNDNGLLLSWGSGTEGYGSQYDDFENHKRTLSLTQYFIDSRCGYSINLTPGRTETGSGCRVDFLAGAYAGYDLWGKMRITDAKGNDTDYKLSNITDLNRFNIGLSADAYIGDVTGNIAFFIGVRHDLTNKAHKKNIDSNYTLTRFHIGLVWCW